MSGNCTTVPLLTALSTYHASPKWSLGHDGILKKHAPKSERSSGVNPGPAAYNPISCVDKTSKFRKITSSCPFSISKRFISGTTKLAISHAPPGPGSYDPPSDFSSAPHPSVAHITFSKRIRSEGKMIPGVNEPPVYDIRGLHRYGGRTFDPRAVIVNRRHGWYYDDDIKSRRSNPGPGAYNPHFPQEKTDRKFSFGTGDRPSLSKPSSLGIPPPGQYTLPSTLSKESHSFTRSSPLKRITGSSYVGPVCAQPTQFG
jgi:hypothetical protein